MNVSFFSIQDDLDQVAEKVCNTSWLWRRKSCITFRWVNFYIFFTFYNCLIYNRGSLHIVKLSVTWLPVQRNELFSFYMIYQQEAIRWLRLYSYKTHLLALDCVFFCLWDPDAYYPWIQIQLLPLKQMAGPKIWNSLPRNVRNVKNRGNEHFRRSTKQFFLQKCLVSQKNDSWIPGVTDLISGRVHREQLFL